MPRAPLTICRRGSAAAAVADALDRHAAELAEVARCALPRAGLAALGPRGLERHGAAAVERHRNRLLQPLILVATHDSEREQRAHTVVCELAGQNSAPQVVSGELAEVHPVTIAVSGC